MWDPQTSMDPSDSFSSQPSLDPNAGGGYQMQGGGGMSKSQVGGAAMSFGGGLVGGLLQGIAAQQQWKYQQSMAKSQAMVQAAGLNTQAAAARLQGQQAMTVGATNVANIQSATGRDVGSIRAQAARLGTAGGSSYDVIRDVMNTAAQQQQDQLLSAFRERNSLAAQARMQQIQASYVQNSAKYAAGPKPSIGMSMLNGLLSSAQQAGQMAMMAG